MSPRLRFSSYSPVPPLSQRDMFKIVDRFHGGIFFNIRTKYFSLDRVENGCQVSTVVMFLFFSSVGVSIDFTVEFFSILGRNIFRWIVLRTDAKFSLWLCFSSSVVVFDFRIF